MWWWKKKKRGFIKGRLRKDGKAWLPMGVCRNDTWRIAYTMTITNDHLIPGQILVEFEDGEEATLKPGESRTFRQEIFIEFL